MTPVVVLEKFTKARARNIQYDDLYFPTYALENSLYPIQFLKYCIIFPKV